MTARPVLVVCDCLRADVEAAIEGTDLEPVPVRSFAARCEGDATLPAAMLEHAARAGHSLHVLGASCVHRLGVEGAAAAPCVVHEQKQCAYVVANEALVDALQQDGAYVVTPGWLARWRERLAAGGLDVPTASALFKEVGAKVVLLDTGTLPGAAEKLTEMARALDVPEGRLPVSRVVLLEKLRRMVREGSWTDPSDPPREPASAEYAMALDLLGDLGTATSEDDLVTRVTDACRVLLAPRRVSAWRYRRDAEGSPQLIHQWPAATDDANPPPEAPALDAQSTGRADHASIVVPIGSARERWGLLFAEDVLFPAHLEDYLHIMRFIGGLAHVALINLHSAAPSRRETPPAPIATICAYCKDVKEGDRWTRIEAYLLPRLAIRFSHGMCPACFEKHFGEPA